MDGQTVDALNPRNISNLIATVLVVLVVIYFQVSASPSPMAACTRLSRREAPVVEGELAVSGRFNDETLPFKFAGTCA